MPGHCFNYLEMNSFALYLYAMIGHARLIERFSARKVIKRADIHYLKPWPYVANISANIRMKNVLWLTSRRIFALRARALPSAWSQHLLA